MFLTETQLQLDCMMVRLDTYAVYESLLERARHRE